MTFSPFFLQNQMRIVKKRIRSRRYRCAYRPCLMVQAFKPAGLAYREAPALAADC